jgi:uncharacterized short protein YbdD (DUF466 family)
MLGAAMWYLRELTGEGAYERYLERHPQNAPISRRDFERQRTDRQDSDPGTRCC